MTYEEVKQAVAELQAAGEYPSKERVRERLGRGSHQDLFPLIVQAKKELAVVETPTTGPGMTYSWPSPNPQRVQTRLAERVGQRAVEDVIAYAEGALVQLELMTQEISQASAWGLSHGWSLPQELPDRETREGLMRELRRFLRDAPLRFDEIRGTTQENSYGPKPAA